MSDRCLTSRRKPLNCQGGAYVVTFCFFSYVSAWQLYWTNHRFTGATFLFAQLGAWVVTVTLWRKALARFTTKPLRHFMPKICGMTRQWTSMSTLQSKATRATAATVGPVVSEITGLDELNRIVLRMQLAYGWKPLHYASSRRQLLNDWSPHNIALSRT